MHIFNSSAQLRCECEFFETFRITLNATKDYYYYYYFCHSSFERECCHQTWIPSTRCVVDCSIAPGSLANHDKLNDEDCQCSLLSTGYNLTMCVGAAIVRPPVRQMIVAVVVLWSSLVLASCMPERIGKHIVQYNHFEN